jgi:hypothetical protein
MAVILVDGSGLGASRPDRPLFANVDLTVLSGERIGPMAAASQR